MAGSQPLKPSAPAAPPPSITNQFCPNSTDTTRISDVLSSAIAPALKSAMVTLRSVQEYSREMSARFPANDSSKHIMKEPAQQDPSEHKASTTAHHAHLFSRTQADLAEHLRQDLASILSTTNQAVAHAIAAARFTTTHTAQDVSGGLHKTWDAVVSHLHSLQEALQSAASDAATATQHLGSVSEQQLSTSQKALTKALDRVKDVSRSAMSAVHNAIATAAHPAETSLSAIDHALRDAESQARIQLNTLPGAVTKSIHDAVELASGIIGQAGQSLHTASDTAHHFATEAKDTVQQQLHHVAASVSNIAGQAVHATQRKVEQAASAVETLGSDVMDKVQEEIQAAASVAAEFAHHSREVAAEVEQQVSNTASVVVQNAEVAAHRVGDALGQTLDGLAHSGAAAVGAVSHIAKDAVAGASHLASVAVSNTALEVQKAADVGRSLAHAVEKSANDAVVSVTAAGEAASCKVQDAEAAALTAAAALSAAALESAATVQQQLQASIRAVGSVVQASGSAISNTTAQVTGKLAAALSKTWHIVTQASFEVGQAAALVGANMRRLGGQAVAAGSYTMQAITAAAQVTATSVPSTLTQAGAGILSSARKTAAAVSTYVSSSTAVRLVPQQAGTSTTSQVRAVGKRFLETAALVSQGVSDRMEALAHGLPKLPNSKLVMFAADVGGVARAGWDGVCHACTLVAANALTHQVLIQKTFAGLSWMQRCMYNSAAATADLSRQIFNRAMSGLHSMTASVSLIPEAAKEPVQIDTSVQSTVEHLTGVSEITTPLASVQTPENSTIAAFAMASGLYLVSAQQAVEKGFEGAMMLAAHAMHSARQLVSTAWNGAGLDAVAAPAHTLHTMLPVEESPAARANSKTPDPASHAVIPSLGQDQHAGITQNPNPPHQTLWQSLRKGFSNLNAFSGVPHRQTPHLLNNPEVITVTVNVEKHSSVLDHTQPSVTLSMGGPAVLSETTLSSVQTPASQPQLYIHEAGIPFHVEVSLKGATLTPLAGTPDLHSSISNLVVSHMEGVHDAPSTQSEDDADHPEGVGRHFAGQACCNLGAKTLPMRKCT